MYEMGWGTTADKAKAIELYTRAAERGNQLAVDNLRRLGAPAPAAKEATGSPPVPAVAPAPKPAATME